MSYSIIVEMVIIETFMNVVLVHFEEAGRKEDRAITDILAAVPPPLGFFEHQRAERMIKAAFFHKIASLHYWTTISTMATGASSYAPAKR